MRMWLWFAVLMTVAACATTQPLAQNDLPTLAPDAETPAPAAAPTDDNQAVESEATIEEPTLSAEASAVSTGESAMAAIEREIGVLPPPGTLIAAPVTEEAVPGATPVPFVSVQYQETGGPSNVNLFIEIFRDGRVIRDEVETSVSPQVIAEIEQTLDELNFFGIQGQFTLPGASPDVYTYAVRVELEDGSAKRIEAQDNVTPPELLRLFSQLRNIGL